MTLVSPSPEGSAARDPLVSIQYLRGLAALAVVFHHAFTGSLTQGYAAFGLVGAAGVDVFFVISGFIIWTTAGTSAGSVPTFVGRRALRIYPAYWLALLAWILVRAAVPDRLGGADVTAATVPPSFLLVPHWHAVFTGHAWPILVPGWTLQFEVFFYAVFAASLLLPPGRPRAAAVFLLIGGLVALGWAVRPAGAVGVTYTSPLLLEFLGGVGLALLRPALRRLGLPGGLVLLAAGFAVLAALHTGEEPIGAGRVLAWGVPAILIVAGGIAAEAALSRRPSRALLRLGDASYSLYLSHPFSLVVVSVAWRLAHLPVAGAAVAALVAVQVAVALVGGLLFYQLVELPILRLVRDGRKGGAAAKAAGMAGG